MQQQYWKQVLIVNRKFTPVLGVTSHIATIVSRLPHYTPTSCYSPQHCPNTLLYFESINYFIGINEIFTYFVIFCNYRNLFALDKELSKLLYIVSAFVIILDFIEMLPKKWLECKVEKFDLIKLCNKTFFHLQYIYTILSFV